jgi:hypothetical protein
VAEEIGRGDPGDGRTSHPGASRCLEGPIKKSIEFAGLDGFLRKRVNEEERVFSILIYHYTRSKLKED